MLQLLTGGQLTTRVAAWEAECRGADQSAVRKLLDSAGVTQELLGAAYDLKRVAGQIHVIIHAVGILAALPHLLHPDETIEYLSLGAGNTGRNFDLETNTRVAEFKFIHWQGGSETIRQNALFKDFYLLAEHHTRKRKFLYVLGTKYPLKFMKSRRKLSSVMSRNRKLWDEFEHRYGGRYEKVFQYYAANADAVTLEDISPFVPELAGMLEASAEDEASAL